MSVPALRFKEFSGDWDENKLGDIADLTSSKRVYLSDYVSEGIPFYRGKEISELKRNETPKDILYITTKAYNAFKASYGVPQVDDILITAVGTLGNVYRIKDDSEFYFKDGNLIWLRDIKILSAFLEILFETNNEAIQKSSIGSTQRALTIVELKKLKFSIPSLPEQTKIANFLTAVDEKISLLTQKTDLLSQYKKGVMQQIFSQELRFKDDDGQEFPEWKEKTLGDVCKPQQWKTISASELTEFGYPAYGANGQIGFYSEYNHEDETVAVTCRGATCGEVTLIPPKSYITGNSMSLDDINPQYNNRRYVYYALILRGFRDVISGSAQPQIIGAAIRRVEISVPSLSEQTKIANFLTAVDEKITNNQTQLNAVKQYKQGLLQQMFV